MKLEARNDGIESLMGQKHWFCVRTKLGKEMAVDAFLRSDDFETFCPKVQYKRAGRKPPSVIRPLFPTYTFARFDPGPRLPHVRSAHSVIGVVGFGQKLAVVPKEVIAFLRKYCKENQVLVPFDEPREGDLVEVLDGPFRGLRGIVEREMSDGERVRVLLEVLGLHAPVEVHREQVEKV